MLLSEERVLDGEGRRSKGLKAVISGRQSRRTLYPGENAGEKRTDYALVR